MESDRRVMQLVPHYYKLYLPDHRCEKFPLLVALHGYAGDMESMMRLARAVSGEEMIVASVQGPHQFFHPSVESGDSQKVGFGWQTPYKSEDSVTRHHHLIQRVIRECTAAHSADASRVFLMGFSQACAMNYRLAFSHPGLLRGVIGVCGGLPGDFSDPKYRSTATSVLHIGAVRDQFYPLVRVRSFESGLRRLAEDVTYREYDAPHAFPRRSIPHIRQWILDRI